ncbi:hypothetical protein NDU88_007342 [Pleurodeles waltl]|uniref:Uncharacterized protein n=1 Tax=Pleurodeles waltl TaxID=8319 RepID=A0AAV7U3B6_PLEWA|nr:hypothetical protein NDU88_007342 [Pleurodeles waltl]
MPPKNLSSWLRACENSYLKVYTAASRAGENPSSSEECGQIPVLEGNAVLCQTPSNRSTERITTNMCFAPFMAGRPGAFSRLRSYIKKGVFRSKEQNGLAPDLMEYLSAGLPFVGEKV